MNRSKVLFIVGGLMTFFAGNAHATTSSQILVMSKQIYQIGLDLTTGMLPSAIALLAIGIWMIVNIFGKNMGDNIHHLTNILAVCGIVWGAVGFLTNAGMFSVTF